MLDSEYVAAIAKAEEALQRCSESICQLFSERAEVLDAGQEAAVAAATCRVAAHFVQRVVLHECTVKLTEKEAMDVIVPGLPTARHKLAEGVWQAYRLLSCTEHGAAEGEGETSEAALLQGQVDTVPCGLIGVGRGYATPDLVKELHAHVLGSTRPEIAGKLRKSAAMPMQCTKQYMRPALIPAGLEAACDTHNEGMERVRRMGSDRAATVAAAAEVSATFFHELLFVHPFADGNGRTARVALCASMGQTFGLPFTLLQVSRDALIAALQSSRSGHALKQRLGTLQLANMILLGLEDALQLWHETFASVATPATHWIDIPASADEGALSAQLRAKAGLLDFSSTIDIPVLARLLLESAKGSCVAVPVEADGGTMLLLQPRVNSSALGAATAQ